MSINSVKKGPTVENNDKDKTLWLSVTIKFDTHIGTSKVMETVRKKKDRIF